MRRHIAFRRRLAARRLAVCLTALLGLPALTGCGPLMSTYLIISAQAELDGAQAAEAEKYAVYEYTASSEYLAKAREEQGYADFGPAIDYAFKAQELAVKAKERAESERDKQRAPDFVPEGASGSSSPTPAAPRVIIEKQPSQGATSVEIVPISPEQPE